ncbi:DNRLRE domain-containing protein [Coraliomargarita sp. SDUM461003]|uniref:DNRLRE domain-containing protein n=1 Tax=Thalassobacterium maritimum TaxID=3041265 RepID=A0ABU1B0Q9_9BACT|nr:DNRLRE domain-containing protein [Coraliomargarita sp. SDUM461003]MDQ8208867.1 DNRLRE domain-containing protein [Coraliomargarita sp. SDUM461003]
MKYLKWNVSILRMCLTFVLYLTAFQIVQLNKIYAQSDRDWSNAAIDSAWTTVPLGGGGYVTGLASNSDGSAIYCRTDVGGAFRWSPRDDDPQGNGTWISLSDHMVPFGTPKANKLMGVESIATDPGNLDRVYVGAGNKIFLSEDRGSSWTEILSELSMTPNSPTTRFFGERLAVDPNDPNVIWYGSIKAGLQKGVRSGEDWAWTQVPASSVPFGVPAKKGRDAGVTFVLCDANDGNTITYAGVFDGASSPTTGGIYKSSPTTGGIYKTSDGINWTKVPMASGSFNTPRRAQMASNGKLYITGGGEGVFKLPRGGSISAITPSISEAYFNGVAVDPNDHDGNIVYVADKASKKIWRSADGGVSWAEQDSTSDKRQEPDGTPTLNGYWFGNIASLLVNPADSNELWVSDFFGVARTRDAQNLGASGATWYMLQNGLEETVVMDVLNAPTGAQLITGVADISGFYYNDTTLRPTGAGGGKLTNPSGANSTSLDFSEADHDVWVRAWHGNYGNGSGGYSSDGGKSWLLFGEIDQVSIDSGAADWESWDLSTYLAKQQAKGVSMVTLVIVSKNATNFTRTPVQFASNEAADASLRPQLIINGASETPFSPIADTYVAGSKADKESNFGSFDVLKASHTYTTNTTNDLQIYMKFDLSAMSPISSATLKLHRLDAKPGIVYGVGVFACANTSWTENELTWKNRPLTYASSNSARNPFAEPRYKTATGVRLAGGRVAASSTDPDKLVWLPVGSKNRAYYSDDRGVTWTQSTGGPSSEITGVYTNGHSTEISGQPLAADRVNGDFYMANFGSSAHQIYRSTDDGATWTLASSLKNGNTYNMRTPQIVAAPASPSNPSGGDVWVCDDSVYNKNIGGLWRSTDSAATWTKFKGVSKVTAVSFGQSQSGTGYAVYIYGRVGSEYGVYRSDDYGSTWTKLADPTIKKVTALAGDRQKYGRVFIGTAGRGVFQYE